MADKMEKSIIRFDLVTYTYPDASIPVLDNVTLHMLSGEFVLVAGASGSGKSTLLRCINGLVPHFSGGEISGYIDVAGQNPIEASPRLMSQTVGFVFQDPESQFVMDRVEDEIAFGMENAALSPEVMETRMSEVLHILGITHLRQRMLTTLSGGEKQRVAIAAALVLQPKVLVLDEPTSQLDPDSAAQVLEALHHLHQILDITIVLVEQRLERVLSYADRIVYIPGKGQAVVHGMPHEVLPVMQRVPPVVRVAKALEWDPLPLSMNAALAHVETHSLPAAVDAQPPSGATFSNREQEHAPWLSVRDSVVAYGDKVVVDHVDVDLYPREIVTLMGRNAAGKTTLLRAMLGLVKLNYGSVFINGESIQGKPVAEICRDAGYLPQDPNALLFAETALEELEITLRNHGLDGQEIPMQPVDLLTRLDMADKLEAYPRDMSVGERQRVALGAVMIHYPGLLLLDEPTRGLDYAAKAQLTRLLRQWRDAGLAILVVTHDVEFAAHLADRVWLMDAGKIYAKGSPFTIFEQYPEFAPDMVRLFPGRGWLTPGDVIEALTGDRSA